MFKKFILNEFLCFRPKKLIESTLDTGESKNIFFWKISAAWRRNFATTCENYVLAKILLVWSRMNFYKETTTCNDVAMTCTIHKKSFKKIPFIKILKNQFSWKNTPKHQFFDKLELKKILIKPISISNTWMFLGIIRTLKKVMMTL